MNLGVRANLLASTAAVAVLALVGCCFWAAWMGLPEALRATVAEAVVPRLGLIAMIACVGAGLSALGVRALYFTPAARSARLAEEIDLLAVHSEGARQLDLEQEPATLRPLVAAINRLAQRDNDRLRDVQARVAQARAEAEDERNRFATLVGELAQCVIVCNAAGRILLYNRHARLLFGDSPLLGLGRSLSGLVDASVEQYLRERFAERLAQGERNPQLGFLSATPAGRLLRVRMSPVRHGSQELAGFVLLAEDITDAAAVEQRRRALLDRLALAQRGLLGRARAAVQELGAAQAAAQAAAARSALDEQLARLEASLTDTLQRYAAERALEPHLEAMRGAQLLAVAQRRIAARCGLTVRTEPGTRTLWLRADGYSLVQALTALANRVGEACGPREIELSLDEADGQAQLDLSWVGGALSTETVLGWELEPMTLMGESSPLSVREVLGRHGAELSYQRERASTRARFRLSLPLTEPDALVGEPPHDGSRPEFYDFNLFAWSDSGRALEDRPLVELAYTVFDTETTGLDPSGGDEIIQIGAVRILRERLLHQERFEQLVDPRRDIHSDAVRIHGITRQQLAGQPGIEQVLPRFHEFAHDSVLVAHNAAFDMRFLQLKESATGLHFDQPVLDTLLLSVVLHPNQASHRLEAIAERLGVPVLDRHDAMGDALATAQIFLRMIPLLAQQGITTLGQARAASEQTYHARLQY